jgi:alkylation response protein AidB-like acyl-CoA dehydrogenase
VEDRTNRLKEAVVIDLAEDEDQTAIAEIAARVLAQQGPTPDGANALWKQCAELGWLALALPEDAGGVGYGASEQVSLFRELGRALADGPFLDNSLAAHAALADGRRDLAAALADGSVRAVLAEEFAPGQVAMWADHEPAAIVLLRDGSGGARLLDGERLRTIESRVAIDPSYRRVTAEVDDLGAVPALAAEVAARITSAGQLLSAAMLAGIAERTRDMSVGYALDRVQYGRPIGTFQAVKHRCADMAVRAEAAWAVTGLAAVGLDASLASAGFDATAAYSVASGAALINARDNIQNHGAIGFTEEHRAQHFLKRAHILTNRLGTTRSRRDALLNEASPW